MKRPDPHVELVEFRALNCPGVIGMALCRVDGEEVEPLVATIDDDGTPLVSSKPIVWLDNGVGIDLGALFGGTTLSALPDHTRARVIRLVQARAIDVIAGGAG